MSTIVVPTSASLGAWSSEVADALAVGGDRDARVAGEVIAIATAAKEDIEALEAGAQTSQAQISVPLYAILADGTPLAAWADNASSNPGITLTDSKTVCIRWNNNGTQTPVWLHTDMPQDLDDTADMVLHLLVSKTGATVGDATTMTVTGFFQTPGALHDADADVGGTTSAVVGNATAKTVTELELTIAAANVPATPAGLTFSVQPTDGTLGTDDFCMHACWIEYTRKILPS